MVANRFTRTQQAIRANQSQTIAFKRLNVYIKGYSAQLKLTALLLLLQVIVTTPMEMLKIQLQDAGRIGKRNCIFDFKELKEGCMEKEWPHVAMSGTTTALFHYLKFAVISHTHL